MNEIPEGVILPNPENSIETKDVAPIECIEYEEAPDDNAK